ncbi:hypothetical protein V1264_019823 [Littorina saxatilis]|uniref:Uncharacterized protein n=1 Tax=Littorina saxatilis TaxID=31220 RepID=A0AAN9B8S7_9CAEN
MSCYTALQKSRSCSFHHISFHSNQVGSQRDTPQSRYHTVVPIGTDRSLQGSPYRICCPCSPCHIRVAASRRDKDSGRWTCYTQHLHHTFHTAPCSCLRTSHHRKAFDTFCLCNPVGTCCSDLSSCHTTCCCSKSTCSACSLGHLKTACTS